LKKECLSHFSNYIIALNRTAVAKIFLTLFSFNYLFHTPVALPDNILLNCMSQIKHPGKRQMQGARITPTIPKWQFFARKIANGILMTLIIIDT